MDIACGVGHLLNYLALRLEGVGLLGIDITPEYVHAAAERSAKLGLGSRFAVRDAFECLDDLLVGRKNAAVTLHGCNYLSQRVLRLHEPQLLMVVPCCYNGLAPDDYFMSAHAKARVAESGLRVDKNLGSIAILGSGTLTRSQQIRKMDAIKKVLAESDYALSTEDEFMLQMAGVRFEGVGERNYGEIAEAVHKARRKYALFKKFFVRPIEALFSADKAIYLNEQGRESFVYNFMPYSLSPRNNLIVGK